MTTFQKLLTLTSLCSLATTLAAVTVDTNGIENKALYSIEFPSDSKTYYGRENVIHSISKQEYITTGFRVVEINIVTSGSALLRIYHSRVLLPGELQAAMMDGVAAVYPSSDLQAPATPSGVQAITDRLNEGADAITSDAVLKEYPHATHAHTIEYRVQTRRELLDLFDQLQLHWLKAPAYFEDGQIVEADLSTTTEMAPRTLGGTRFIVE